MKEERKYLRIWKNQKKYRDREGDGAFYKRRDAYHNKNRRLLERRKKKQTPENMKVRLLSTTSR